MYSDRQVDAGRSIYEFTLWSVGVPHVCLDRNVFALSQGRRASAAFVWFPRARGVV